MNNILFFDWGNSNDDLMNISLGSAVEVRINNFDKNQWNESVVLPFTNEKLSEREFILKNKNYFKFKNILLFIDILKQASNENYTFKNNYYYGKVLEKPKYSVYFDDVIVDIEKVQAWYYSYRYAVMFFLKDYLMMPGVSGNNKRLKFKI